MNIYDLTLFKDSKLTFIYKKSHALAKALYMITQHFQDEEPLKWTIRSRANRLLEESLSLSLAALISSSVEIMSLVEIASFSGLISERNFHVLKLELESLFEKVDSEKDPLLSLYSAEVKPLHVEGQGNIKDNASIDIKKTGIKSKGQMIIKDNKSDRKRVILNLLKEKSDLSIKDISQAFKDCGEKTIQRELIQMLNQGLLQKKGERRWSKYSLKTL